MVGLSCKSVSLALLLLIPSGCCYPVRSAADQHIADLAVHPLDVRPPDRVDTPPPMPPAEEHKDQPKPGAAQGPIDASVHTAAAQLPEPRTLPGRPLSERLQIPRELPGAGAAPIQLPRDPREREAAITRLFPGLPPLGPDPEPVLGPGGCLMSLSQLQELAITNSPVLRQAAADVEAARGAVLQAGLYPNPTVGYQMGTFATGGGAGYQGPYFEQLIKTGGKLQLAQAAATMQLRNAELAMRKAQADLASQVRAGYFSVLVARENLRVTRALSVFTNEVYQIEVEQVKGAQAAPYEPMQMRVLAIQARAALVQARNRYVSSWKQLTATLGLPAMPPTELEGRVDMPIPVYQYDRLLAQVLTAHTDVLTAENLAQRERYNLRLAQVGPVPDVDVQVFIQKDFTTPQSLISPTVQVNVPVPVWNRNQGNIAQAQANLLRATEEGHRVRCDLTQRVAEAFARYENNRILLDYFRTYILPDQVRAYRGAFERHQQEPDRVGFGDVVNAQQILATGVTGYVTALGDMWTAVVDLGNLLQTNDLFQVGPESTGSECVAAVPQLEALPPLPCCHPSSPLPEPWLKGADGTWPAALPHALEKLMPPAEQARNGEKKDD
ncbi:MAG: TolC family protein [Gemmataceae bacterium]|nr:TolC family protein [Gemmataceae bacterium]